MYYGPRGADEAEEVGHFDVGDQAVVPFEERLNRGHGHTGHGVKEQPQQGVLQAAQREIEPAGQAPVTAKGPPAELPQPFGKRAHRAKPGAEALAQQPGDGQESDQQKHTGRLRNPVQ